MWIYAVIGMEIVSIGVGAYVSHEKSRPVPEGIMLGLLLGPIGSLIAAMLPTGKCGPPPLPYRRRKAGEDEQPINIKEWILNG